MTWKPQKQPLFKDIANGEIYENVDGAVDNQTEVTNDEKKRKPESKTATLTVVKFHDP